MEQVKTTKLEKNCSAIVYLFKVLIKALGTGVNYYVKNINKDARKMPLARIFENSISRFFIRNTNKGRDTNNKRD